jgi:hypothetical protein
MLHRPSILGRLEGQDSATHLNRNLRGASEGIRSFANFQLNG